MRNRIDMLAPPDHAARYGDAGDGVVAVTPVDRFYRIRTRSEGLPDDSSITRRVGAL